MLQYPPVVMIYIIMIASKKKILTVFLIFFNYHYKFIIIPILEAFYYVFELFDQTNKVKLTFIERKTKEIGN